MTVDLLNVQNTKYLFKNEYKHKSGGIVKWFGQLYDLKNSMNNEVKLIGDVTMANMK
eukprot:CAMPEP_0116891834 /NCGR_PEP_ID=MMETSP0467-20121206/2171_1 /TAXON_ID=283647 /ORGANISM="Mesodinium pulex, Strain SPMC105" /LENGTH=56 /DNA_ID=CAMNT_0004560587 /DNA_START=1870 /DNA_END=2040 /DNA_ORIENTATION=+